MVRSTLYCAVICLSLSLGDFKQSYIIKEATPWSNEIKKCASGGDDAHTYRYTIGKLNDIGLLYKDIDELTTVIAFGKIRGSTNAVVDAVPVILLHDYKEDNGMKQFSVQWGFEAVCGWGKQRARVHLTINFLESGTVELVIYVYAASWGAVSCAEAKAYVEKIQVVN